MKIILPLLLLALLFTFKLSPPTLEMEQEDYQVYVYPAKWPTREEVKVAAFREELPQAKELIRRESNDNPTAINSTSGAGGVPQALPPSKMGCRLTQDIRDYMCQIFWMKGYVLQRYGSFTNALAWHTEHNWY